MYRFIVNPMARTGLGKSLWDELAKKLDNAGVQYAVYMTQQKGDARKLAGVAAADRSDPLEPIIVVGGDGTVGDVLSGLPLEEPVVFGAIPTGSGNDFFRGLGLDPDINKSLERILNSKETKDIDIGEVNCGDLPTRRFAVSAGIGYDAAICDEINHSKLKDAFNAVHLAPVAYTLIGLKQSLTYPEAKGTISFDDNEPFSFSHLGFISFHNLKYEGGGWPFAPQAIVDDGQISSCLMSCGNHMKFTAAMLSVKKNKHSSHKGVRLDDFKKASVHIDLPLTVHTDGEILGKFTDLEVRVLSGKVRLLV